MAKFNPAIIPTWVSGGQTKDGSSHKYHRAIKQLQEENAALKIQGKEPVELTEEAIKNLYVSWGGLVLDGNAPEIEEEIVAPRPRTRKA